MQEMKGEGQNKQQGLSWSTPASGAQAPKQPTPAPVSAHAPITAIMPPTPKGGGGAKYAGMIGIGILAGVLAAWGYSTLYSPVATNTTSEKTTTDTSNTNDKNITAVGALGVDTNTLPTIGSSASLSIMSPQRPGDSVAIESAIVAVPTWIVVYEDKDGTPGNALGAALFFPGQPSGTVELLRSTVSGKSYLAVKQQDNGDRKFSLKDDAYLAENGKVMWVPFEVK